MIKFSLQFCMIVKIYVYKSQIKIFEMKFSFLCVEESNMNLGLHFLKQTNKKKATTMSDDKNRTNWYNYVDINLLLNKFIRENESHIILISDTSENDVKLTTAVDSAIQQLDDDDDTTSALIPINVARNHWVGLVIRRSENSDNNQAINEIEKYQAFYADSFGIEMDQTLPNLRKILNNHTK